MTTTRVSSVLESILQGMMKCHSLRDEQAKDCISCLEDGFPTTTTTPPVDVLLTLLTHHVARVADAFVASTMPTATMVVASKETKTKKKQHHELRVHIIESAHAFLSSSSSSVLSIVMIVGSLAIRCSDNNDESDHETSCRFVASALAQELGRHCSSSQQHDSCSASCRDFVFGLLMIAQDDDDSIDLSIVCSLARALSVASCDEPQELEAVVKTVQRILPLTPTDSTLMKKEEEKVCANTTTTAAPPASSTSRKVPAALALVAQLRPSLPDPTLLVDIAVNNNLWFAAERLAQCYDDGEVTLFPTLIQAALDAGLYRQADTYATTFFRSSSNNDDKAADYFLEARYGHACSTITKVTRKRAFAVIEKQVERIDTSVQECLEKKRKKNALVETASQDIRMFALEQLTDCMEVDAAQRLASAWKIPYEYNEEALEAIRQAKREKYLQWEEVAPSQNGGKSNNTAVPDLIQDEDSLRAQFCLLLRTKKNNSAEEKQSKVIGFDAEWGEEGKGAAVVQIASRELVLLIDVIQLCQTVQGGQALEDTVGKLFASEQWTKVGFACAQDIRQMRASGPNPWIDEVKNVVDLQTRTRKSKQLLGGLSRCCQTYLGKPLDKAEQCSGWTRRPLTVQQRIYAALDALTCVLIYDKLSQQASNP